MSMFDCLLTGLIYAVVYILLSLLWSGWGWLQVLRRRRHQEGINTYLRRHQRYPFNLPIAEPWPAGEYVCEHCGANNYFSITRVEPHQLPPGRLRDESVEASVIDPETRSVSTRGVFQAPVVLKCARCLGLCANGEAAALLRPQGGGDD